MTARTLLICALWFLGLAVCSAGAAVAPYTLSSSIQAADRFWDRQGAPQPCPDGYHFTWSGDLQQPGIDGQVLGLAEWWGTCSFAVKTWEWNGMEDDFCSIVTHEIGHIRRGSAEHDQTGVMSAEAFAASTPECGALFARLEKQRATDLRAQNQSTKLKAKRLTRGKR